HKILPGFWTFFLPFFYPIKEAFPGEPDIPIMLGSWIPHHPVYAFENYGKETSLLKAIYNRWTGNQEISRFW
ncbi:MAG: hypothetical protein PHQ43_14195, partial [Dehalococcoidales bacterium]|nr:hypothetical protein [Dehalococcoidales bacterium]